MFQPGDKVFWERTPGAKAKVNVVEQIDAETVIITYRIKHTNKFKKRTVNAGTLTYINQMFQPGDKVFWERTPGAKAKVNVVEQIDAETVIITYRIKHTNKFKKRTVNAGTLTLRVSVEPSSSSSAAIDLSSSTDASAVDLSSSADASADASAESKSSAVDLSEPMTDKGSVARQKRPKKFKLASIEMLKDGTRFGVDIFNSKVAEVFSKFWTKRVPGDGWCLLHSANLLIKFYELQIYPYTKEDLRRIGRQMQDDFADDWTIDDKTGTPVKNILTNELINPSNLSENWAAFLAKEMDCRFIIFTCQSRIDAEVLPNEAEKRKYRPKMDVWSFTAREVLPYPADEKTTYTHTFYLYNNGHYWPLIPRKQVNPNELIMKWGNQTYEHIVEE